MSRRTLGLSRRGFFAAVGSAAAAGALFGRAGAAAGEEAQAKAAAALEIPTRRMGRTNVQVSVISGNETMSDPALVEAAIDAGVNYWHKAGAYLGPALKKYGREKLYVEICLDPSGSAEKDVENFKKHLGKWIDYADFYKIHGTYNEKSVEAFKKLEEQGLAKYLAASFHSYDDALKALKTGNLDQVQVGGCPVSGEPLAKVLAAAKEADAGVILMKTMQGGEKAWAGEKFKKVLDPYAQQGLKPCQAVTAACLATDGVTTLVVITESIQRLNLLAEAASKTAGKTVTVRPAVTGPAAFCTVCGKCKGVCPKGIAVQDILRAEMYAVGYGEPARGRNLYASIDKSSRAGVCSKCGSCTKACPYRVASPERIAAAAVILA